MAICYNTQAVKRPKNQPIDQLRNKLLEKPVRTEMPIVLSATLFQEAVAVIISHSDIKNDIQRQVSSLDTSTEQTSLCDNSRPSGREISLPEGSSL